ncbi:HlyD family type I secretion periplasmic adaptor subunit [Janthinobacterium sp.]|uniref:HlyD family type I secretion periplasmic adaptor subunit n=1 Tax=Janthinobacterium sp. TaxID=1871054 RepID=UPI00293D9E3C|nr:HlyD family type I secretion periplasmic adaptor subunit [Janthinobacterium sp.]
MSMLNHARALPAADPDPEREPQRIIMRMMALIAAVVVLTLAWATFAELDVSVNGRGSITPPSRLQEVQSLEGGIVREMLARPGQQVRRGDVLVRLDTAQYEANLGASRQNRLAALAGRARLDALLAGGAPQFDAAWRREAPELIEKETQLWRDGQREHAAAGAAGREGVLRRRSELAEARGRIVQLEAGVKLGAESLAIEERLYKEGAGSRGDYLSAQQRLLQQRTELEGLRSSLPRLDATLAEAQASASETDARMRAQWGAQRSEYETKAGALASTVAGQQDQVTRRDITAPVDGVVNRVLVPTVGGVAAPGKAILEIVPADSEVVISVHVKPADIGFIHVGQSASASVLAYDATTYGRLKAQVTRVGADAIPDERNEPYFEVQLSTDRRQLLTHGRVLPITPGMPVDVGILTGKRSVMQYIFKPVLRGLQSSLQER